MLRSRYGTEIQIPSGGGTGVAVGYGTHPDHARQLVAQQRQFLRRLAALPPTQWAI
jgi:hypothetical protein